MVKFMSVHQILAEKTVSISEARKNLNLYFIDEPVAVLSNNRTKGYMLSADLFEQMISIIESKTTVEKSMFRPASARLQAIAHLSEQILLNSSDGELGEFSE